MTTTNTSRPASGTDKLAEMRHTTEQQTNGTLTESYRLLVANLAAGDTSDATKLAKAVIVDELTKRNTHLREALDAWELDLDTTAKQDEIVLAHAAKMKPNLRFHVAHPMDRDPFAGLPDIDEPVTQLPVAPCTNNAAHEPHEWDDATQFVFPTVRCPGMEPDAAFPPAEPEPSISLAQFQQRVAAGEWSSKGKQAAEPAPAEPVNHQQTDYGLSILAALGRPGRHVYGGTVTYRTKTNRRLRNRAARRSRRINRGR